MRSLSGDALQPHSVGRGTRPVWLGVRRSHGGGSFSVRVSPPVRDAASEGVHRPVRHLVLEDILHGRNHDLPRSEHHLIDPRRGGSIRRRHVAHVTRLSLRPQVPWHRDKRWFSHRGPLPVCEPPTVYAMFRDGFRPFGITLTVRRNYNDPRGSTATRPAARSTSDRGYNPLCGAGPDRNFG